MAHVPQRSGDSLGSIPIQRVAGMCKPGAYDSQKRFTSVAIRCDTSEETRMQPREHSSVAKETPEDLSEPISVLSVVVMRLCARDEAKPFNFLMNALLIV